MTSVKWLYIICIIWGGWPSRFRHCNKNQNIPSSNPIRSLAGLRGPTSLQGSQWPLCQKCKKAVINIGGVSSVANNGCLSAIAERLRTSANKKNLEITKITDHFSHTHKKRILKLSNLKDLFFPNIFIQLHLNFFQNLNTQETCICHICVWMLN